MKLILILSTLLMGLALAQPNIVLSPQSIVVNPLPSFNVEVSVNKDASGESSPSYAIGESISLSVRVTEASYIYLFDVRSNGVVDQILPNRLDAAGENNYLQAGETKTFPPQNASYSFTVDGPQGLDKVIAVASKTPLDTRQLADFRSNPDFASSSLSEASFADTLSIVVTPINQSDWVTDTALFYVGAKPAVPAYGTLSITSSPSGAAAYVDNQYVGQTPVRFGTRSGSHTVEVRLNAYDTFRTSVELAGGETRALDARLVSTQAVSPPAASSSLSTRFGLTLYPGANLSKLTEEPNKLKVEFTTSASFEAVFDDLERQLFVNGWQRSSINFKDNASKVDATYLRNGQVLDLKLDKKGNSGKFTLELKL